MKESIPVCPDCRIEGEKFVTTKAALYGIPAIESYEHPEWFSLYWTGEYFCPKCRRAIPRLKRKVSE